MATIQVQGEFLVHTGEVLTFVDETAFEFAASSSGNPSELINKGSINAGFTGDGTAIVGLPDDGPAVFWNKAGATLSVSGGQSDTDGAYGFGLGAPGRLAGTLRLIRVTGVGFATAGVLVGSRLINNGDMEALGGAGTGRGMLISGLSTKVVNHGTLHATGANASGIFLVSHGMVVNTGHITVDSPGDALGITCSSGLSDVRNSGVIQVVDFDGSHSAAISFSGSPESCRIENSGLISAAIAFQMSDPESGTIDIENAGQIIGDIRLASGEDLVRNSGSIVGDIDLGGSSDVYQGQHAVSKVVLYGAGGGDSIYAGAGDDLIYGDRAAADGFDGADLIKGGHGADSLHGGGGADTLRGGAGGDELTGDGGADVFLFTKVSDSAWSKPDLITDLEASDVIDLSGIDADTTQAGDQAFHLVTTLSGQAGEAALSYDRGSHMTRLELDVDGDGHADAVIAIDGDARAFTGFVL